jgi:enoyl-CoA hydratase/3-hydroxyacyl-CoA dehydrogenase
MTTRSFHTLGVVGAGTMGSGIAQKMAAEGFRVVLVDLDDEKVARGLTMIRATLDQGVERGILKAPQVQEILSRIEGSAEMASLARADLVVEAVFEDLAVKRDVFSRLERACRPETILATNTSSFLVSQMAERLGRPERLVGLHYFFHPAKNRLVEVIAGEATSPEIVRQAWSLQEQIGKTPIRSADSSGFVVNRFFVPWLNEAVRMVESRAADIPTIEAACKETFGVGMGPFELMNVTGIPIALHAARTLGESFGPFYAPADALRRQVQSGRPFDLGGPVDPSRVELVGERMLAVTFHVAAQLVDEGVGTIEDTDIGARVGLRWPAGPFELANRHGVRRAAALAGDLAARFGLEVPRLLTHQASADRPFAFRVVDREDRDGVATVRVNRPDAMNALDETVVAQLRQAVDAAIADPAVRAIVLAGAGKAFIAGADVRFFVRNIEAGDFDRIVRFTVAGHALLEAIDRSPKPVVARVQGLALGGGVELALACDRIVASPRASFAFPETGIGIYPGLGGTQRLPRRVGAGLAKLLIHTGRMVGAADAAAIGLVDAVAPYDRLDETIGRILDEPARPERPRPAGDWATLEAFFAAHPVEAIRAGADTGGDAALAQAVKQVGFKAPLALALAERLIDAGGQLSLEAGLRLELEHLLEIFRTADALEGLGSVGRKRPVFHGR